MQADSFISWSGRSAGGGNGFRLQYSCLENPTDKGTRWATVHRVAESDMTEATEHAHTQRKTRPAQLELSKSEESIRVWAQRSRLEPGQEELFKPLVVTMQISCCWTLQIFRSLAVGPFFTDIPNYRPSVFTNVFARKPGTNDLISGVTIWIHAGGMRAFFNENLGFEDFLSIWPKLS